MKITFNKHMMAEKLVNLMAQHQTTNLELQKVMGDISLSSIVNWKKGESIPTLVNLIKISDFYQVTIDSLLSYTITQT